MPFLKGTPQAQWPSEKEVAKYLPLFITQWAYKSAPGEHLRHYTQSTEAAMTAYLDIYREAAYCRILYIRGGNPWDYAALDDKPHGSINHAQLDSWYADKPYQRMMVRALLDAKKEYEDSVLINRAYKIGFSDGKAQDAATIKFHKDKLFGALMQLADYSNPHKLFGLDIEPYEKKLGPKPEEARMTVRYFLHKPNKTIIEPRIIHVSHAARPLSNRAAASGNE